MHIITEHRSNSQSTHLFGSVYWNAIAVAVVAVAGVVGGSFS